jgi:hypothetical protein
MLQHSAADASRLSAPQQLQAAVLALEHKVAAMGGAGPASEAAVAAVGAAVSTNALRDWALLLEQCDAGVAKLQAAVRRDTAAISAVLRRLNAA